MMDIYEDFVCGGCNKKRTVISMGEEIYLCEECLQEYVKDLQVYKRKDQEPCYPGDL